MYIKLTNGVPEKYSIGELRRDNPQVSFPKTIPDSVLADYEVYPLQSTPQPSVDYTQNVAESTPDLLEGVWTQVWSVTDASQEEIDSRVESQWSNIRQERNQLLAECDWTQLPDAPVDSSAWAVYRQALRDITLQADPFNITWPEKP
jgi:hypothetical protein